MARTYDGIDEHQRDWIAKQALFFVGTAPLAGDGHVNVSPKGPIGTLRVLATAPVAYLDVVGSGAETIAHLRENGRDRGDALRLRRPAADPAPARPWRARAARRSALRDLLGRCRLDEPDVPESRRAVVVVDVTRVGRLVRVRGAAHELRGGAPAPGESSAKRVRVHGPDAYRDYQREHNAESLDGLPAVTR